MCTVSFIPTSNNLFITSNRDEKNTRKIAHAPFKYKLPNGYAYFPKDGELGGTWIAAHTNGNVMVLLNGAFSAHKICPNYKKSRGLIFVEILSFNNMITAFDEQIDLTEIEPFKLIAWQDNKLYECIWDGNRKHILYLKKEPQIRSSVTLYSPEESKKKEQYFTGWLNNKQEINQKDIIEFHYDKLAFQQPLPAVNPSALLYNTVSITSVEIGSLTRNIFYKDLSNNTSIVVDFFLSSKRV
jgi:hypothetical protein